MQRAYKGHTREPENVPFINRLKSYAPFINGKNEAALYIYIWTVVCYIVLPFNAVLTVYGY
jgi:hypothetical protein